MSIKRLMSFVALVAALHAGVAVADLATKVNFNIGPQSLSAALLKYSEQSRIQVTSPSELVDGQASGGVVGELAAQEALAQLLKGTELSYEVVDGNTVAIRGKGGEGKPVAGKLGEDVDALRVGQAEASSADSRSSASGQGSEAKQNTSGGAENSEGVKLEEIVVTAQKRKELLKDVPISITVLSGEALDQSTGDGVLDALDRVAGVAITPGNNTGSTITIRGVAPAFASFFTASPIGYYIDSVPFGFLKAAFVPDMSAYDLERVEVLRGPQGTLYGASSVGGLVRVLSKDADLDSTEFKVRSSLSETQHGGLNYGADAAVNVPIVEGVVGARLVAGYHDLSGWIDQPNTGRKEVNDGVNKTLRAKINAEPTDALSLEFSTWFSRNEDGAPSLGSDSRQYLTGIDETQNSDFDLYAFDVGYDFGAFSFSSATSFMSYDFSATTDNTLPPNSTYFTNRQLADVFSQEFQLTSTTDGPWRWTAGAIYREVEERIVQMNQDATGALTGGYVLPVDVSYFSESYAAFGELTRTFLDGHFELTGGLRYFHDDYHGREDSNFTGAPAVGESRTTTFEKVSPRVVASWLPTEHFTAYASYSEGYRSGSDQSPPALFADPTLPAARPDNLRNYEIGFKGDVLDGRLSFDVAAYYMDWQDAQAAGLAFVGPNIFAAVLNASSASGPGIDVSLVTRPTDHLNLGATFSWNDLTFDEAVSFSLGAFEKGDRLGYSPEFTGGVWADYTVPLSGDGYDLRFSASGNYVGERNSRLFGAASSTFVAEPMTIVAARVTLETPGHLSFALFADNLTNEQVPVAGFDSASREDQALRIRPRTVGIQMEYRFGK